MPTIWESVTVSSRLPPSVPMIRSGTFVPTAYRYKADKMGVLERFAWLGFRPAL
jgi:hypothetical protein